MVSETPPPSSFGSDLTLTKVFRDKDAANNFEEGPLTLEKCLEFQKDILDFQNKYNVEVRHTSYLSDELMAEMKARFDLTDSRFYGMVTLGKLATKSNKNQQNKQKRRLFWYVTKNYCGIPNCGYSHAPGIIAAARDQQIIDLTNAKRDMQTGHQAVMKTFEKQGAKVFKRDSSTAERRPQNPAFAPNLTSHTVTRLSIGRAHWKKA